MNDRKNMLLAVNLLEYCAEMGSRRICDDADPAWLAQYSRDELIALNREYHDLNGDPECSYEQCGYMLEMSASSYAHVLAKRFSAALKGSA